MLDQQFDFRIKDAQKPLKPALLGECLAHSGTVHVSFSETLSTFYFDHEIYRQCITKLQIEVKVIAAVVKQLKQL